MQRRVVVTGLGAVTPVGNTAPETWRSLCGGQSGIGIVTQFDPSLFSIQIAGEIKGFDPLQFIDRKAARRLDRNVQIAVAAAKEAQRDAHLEIGPDNAERVGVVIATAIGGLRLTLDSQKQLEERGPDRVSPFFLQNMIPDTASGQVAIELGAQGPNMAVASACASGGHGIGEAAETIRRGDADVVIAGGTESAILPLVFAGFSVMRALAPGNDCPTRACRPFDRTRAGFVLAEGAAMLILESREHAERRGARIYAEIAGYGSGNDAYDLAAPAENGAGLARTMAMALRKAHAQPEDIDYINAHGTGTLLNDKFETAAIKTVFGHHARELAVSSTKSMTGHMMGASGAVEAMVCVFAVAHGVIPPTINYEHPDPACDLDYVPNVARHTPIRAAMSNSMGLGGHNSCILVKGYEG